MTYEEALRRADVYLRMSATALDNGRIETSEAYTRLAEAWMHRAEHTPNLVSADRPKSQWGDH